MDEEAIDSLAAHVREHRDARAQRFAAAAPLAGLVLAGASLLGIRPADLLGQSVVYQVHDLRGLAVAPAVGAVVALIGGWLGRWQLPAQESGGARSIGIAASVVAAAAFVVNLAAFIGLLTTSNGGGIISG